MYKFIFMFFLYFLYPLQASNPQELKSNSYSTCIIPLDIYIKIAFIITQTNYPDMDTSSWKGLKNFCVDNQTTQSLCAMVSRLELTNIDRPNDCVREYDFATASGLIKPNFSSLKEYLQNFSNIQVLFLHSNKAFPPNSIDFVILFPKLKKLFLDRCENILQESFVLLSGLTDLNELVLKDTYSLTNVKFVNKLTNLKYLCLNNCLDLEGGFNKINSSLNILDLSGSSLSKNVKRELAFLSDSNLNTIILTKVLKLKDVKFLKNYKNLTEINLDDTEVKCIQELAGLNFKKLSLQECKGLKEENFLLVARCTNLTDLNLNTNILYQSLFENISALTDLLTLKVSNCGDFNNGSIALLSALSNLEKLVASNTGCSFKDPLIWFPNLKKLNLYNCRLSNDSLEIIAKITKLEKLDISQGCISHVIQDYGIEHLSSLVALTKLNLSGNEDISDQVGAYLIMLPLKFLNVKNCSIENKIEFERLLKDKCPDIKIQW